MSPTSLKSPNASLKSRYHYKHSCSSSPAEPEHWQVKMPSAEHCTLPQPPSLVQSSSAYGQDRYYRDSRLLKQHLSTSSPLLTSPPRYAESPVVLYDVLDEIPDLMSTFIEHPIPGQTGHNTRPPDTFHPPPPLHILPDSTSSHTYPSCNPQSHAIGYSQPLHPLQSVHTNLLSPGPTDIKPHFCPPLPAFHAMQTGTPRVHGPLYPSSYNVPYPPLLPIHTQIGVNHVHAVASSYSPLAQGIPSTQGACTSFSPLTTSHK